MELGGLDIADTFAAKYGPAFGPYLSSQLTDLNITVNALPLKFAQMNQFAAETKYDFVYSNPANYVCLVMEFGISTLVSQVSSRKGQELAEFAGVIFARADNDKVNSIQDFAKASISAVKITGLGAMQIQWATALRQGVNVLTDPVRVEFTNSQPKSVFDVHQGKADIGFVRTDMIEGLVADPANNMTLSDFKILNLQQELRTAKNFPFEMSTEFVPEWPVGALQHVPLGIRERVARALMDLDRHSTDPVYREPATTAGIVTFVPPLSYTGLQLMLEEIDFTYRKEDGTKACLTADDFYDAVKCPAGWIRKPKELGTCSECPEGYQCLCRPCTELPPDEFQVFGVPLETEWKEGIDTGIAEGIVNAASNKEKCERMQECVQFMKGQHMLWVLFDTVGAEGRAQVGLTQISSVEFKQHGSGSGFASARKLADLPNPTLLWERILASAQDRESVESVGMNQTWIYEVDGREVATGGQNVEVKINGKQLDLSPFIVNVRGEEFIEADVTVPAAIAAAVVILSAPVLYFLLRKRLDSIASIVGAMLKDTVIIAVVTLLDLLDIFTDIFSAIAVLEDDNLWEYQTTYLILTILATVAAAGALVWRMIYLRTSLKAVTQAGARWEEATGTPRSAASRRGSLLDGVDRTQWLGTLMAMENSLLRYHTQSRLLSATLVVALLEDLPLTVMNVTILLNNLEQINFVVLLSLMVNLLMFGQKVSAGRRLWECFLREGELAVLLAAYGEGGYTEDKLASWHLEYASKSTMLRFVLGSWQKLLDPADKKPEMKMVRNIVDKRNSSGILDAAAPGKGGNGNGKKTAVAAGVGIGAITAMLD